MANHTIPESTWEKAKEYYEFGLSYSQITEKTGISKAQVGKRANAAGWVKRDDKRQLIVNAEAVKREMAELSETGRLICNDLVLQRTRDMEFFRSASIEIASKALSKLRTEDDISMADIERAQSVIGKGKDNIYGKQPDTAVQINNQTKTYGWEE